jgi:hypothetical protein
MVKQKSRKAKRAPGTKWREVNETRANGDEIGKRLPTGAAPALARPGMIIFTEGSDLAVIEQVTPEYCIARFEDGHVQPFAWGEVQLDNVKPDPAAILEGGEHA